MEEAFSKIFTLVTIREIFNIIKECALRNSLKITRVDSSEKSTVIMLENVNCKVIITLMRNNQVIGNSTIKLPRVEMIVFIKAYAREIIDRVKESLSSCISEKIFLLRGGG